MDEAKARIAALLGGRCEVCRKKYGKCFAIHHKRYLKTDARRGDYTNSKKYHVALEPFVARNRKRFSLLCNKHHHSVGFLSQMEKDRWLRLRRLVNESRP